MSIVTKTGDKGETGLFGGARVSKDDPRLQAVGAIDELNAILGCVLAEETSTDLKTYVERLQHLLFRLGADLATPRENNEAKVPRIEEVHIGEIEKWIETTEAATVMPHYFILPGGSKAAAHLHLARSVCRRAERNVISLSRVQDIGDEIRIFLNRLGDSLFLAALQANASAGTAETRVSYE